MKFHHIGIATKDIKKTFEFVKNNVKVIDFINIIYDKKQDAVVNNINTTGEILKQKEISKVYKFFNSTKSI